MYYGFYDIFTRTNLKKKKKDGNHVAFLIRMDITYHTNMLLQHMRHELDIYGLKLIGHISYLSGHVSNIVRAKLKFVKENVLTYDMNLV